MPLFGNREKAFEQIFAQNEETRFRALARRNRALGRWAVEQLGLTGDEASTYVEEIGKTTATAMIDENLVDRIYADFQAKGAVGSKAQIRNKMSELMAVAIKQVQSGP
jgi:hypothetical protein